LSLKGLWKRSGLTHFTPFYHTVSNKRLDHIWPLYQTVDKDEFVKHLDDLSKYFDFVSAQELIELNASNKKSSGKPKAHLTFDDGLVECHDIIYPILKEKGISATFFINPSFVDSEEIFYRYKIALIINELQNGSIKDSISHEIRNELSVANGLKYTLEESLLSLKYEDTDVINRILKLSDVTYSNSDIYMNSTQINTLVLEGHSIGAHSLDHPNFQLLENQERLDQIEQSLDYCQRQFNQSLRLFAFPFYDFNLPKSLYESMFNELKVDLSFGTSGFKKDVFNNSVQRFPIEDKNSDLIPHIKKSLVYYLLKKIVSKHVMKRK